ncbi:ABC transporter ATP-binding protein [Eubacterium sp. AF36-5BH]|uniref:ABC transporter ATP-binding protein n=1 Tax=Eubacterium sp. AF36-5BH TaxID=2293108 RepID=UPI000E54C508|nr:ABC transporter ATP-binding protein [Eubacterium sp. AF36-5BH]RGF49987.1 ABC transporter ATP-binding protein [Eubacterium sp. AF36-5BH]
MHGRRMTYEKPTGNTFQSLGKLGKYCKPYWAVMIIAVICDMLGVVTKLIGPNKISNITNKISAGLTGKMDIDGIVSICVFLVVLYLVGTALSYITSLIMTIVTQKLNKGLRTNISKKINNLPIGYFHKTTTGDVLSRVTNDVDTIGTTMQSSITTLVSAVTMFVGSIVMMVYTNVVMAITAILASVIGFILMFLIMGHSQKYFAAKQKWLGAMNGHIEEVYSGHNIVKLFNGEAKEKEKFIKLNEKMCESDWKSQFFSGLMQPIMAFIGNFAYVAVCVMGAYLVMNDYTTFGTIVAFMIYVRLFTNPLAQMAQAATQLQSTAAASGRVFEFLESEEMEDESHKVESLPKSIKGDVEFDHVKFGYTKDKVIIHDFNEHVKPGQKVAIVGPTGAGKSTLVNLLMRFYEVDSGDIKIDGISTKDLTRENIHDLFGMVLQDTWTFEGSIRENLAYGKENVTDEQLDKVCKAAGLSHFIKSLPKGYDTTLDEKLNMSAGQKQLLTIARAMVEDAPMMILDEATSSVDTRTEIKIQEAMDKLTKGRTSFVIAHRLSTIKNADIILVLKDGDIIESGNHQQLMEQKGFYADLYNSQFEQVS